MTSPPPAHPGPLPPTHPGPLPPTHPVPLPPTHPVPTTLCARCRETVPVAAFCGRCGSDMSRPANARFAGARPRNYAPAPRERVLAPAVSSTLFPHLPRAHRNPFRIGMAVVLAGVVGMSLLHWTGPLVILAALGVPALFVLYLWEADIVRDLPRHVLVLAAALGIACGVGWVGFTGGLIARAYGVPVAAGFVLENLASVGLQIAVGGVVFMVAPAVLVRFLLRHETRESLDGFAIGALGALSFTAAATTTRLAPQFVSGLLEHVPPLRRLIEAVLYGLAAPITAAALGGLIGILLWFRPGRRAAERAGLIRFSLVAFTALVLVIYLAIWLIDASPLPRWPQLALHLLLTVVALVATRLCLQLALLHEAPDRVPELPVLCLNCEQVVPDMPFCPGCGFATRALSRSTRRQRRERPPIRQNVLGATDV